jgi:hypothetical protein
VPLNNDNNEKRARFDALPSPEVCSDEVRDIPVTGGGYVGRIVDWLKSKGVIGQYKNDETGWDNIAVSRSSVKGVIHHYAGAGKITLLEATPDLIKNGIFLETNPKNDNGLISHIFAGKATVDGVPYAVSYVIREDKNGRRYYDHSLIKLATLDRIDSQAPTLTNKNVHQIRAHISPAGGHLAGEESITDRKSTGTQHQLTWPSAQPAGEESTVNILKKHIGVNPKNKL